jgi:hypothetical protein
VQGGRNFTEQERYDPFGVPGEYMWTDFQAIRLIGSYPDTLDTEGGQLRPFEEPLFCRLV